jgi:hypothetical protein
VVRDQPDDLQRLLLERSDGSRVVALWRPVSVWDQNRRVPVDPGEQQIRLTFGGVGARDVSVWRPSVSAEPTLRRESVHDLSLPLAGDLVLVSYR